METAIMLLKRASVAERGAELLGKGLRKGFGSAGKAGRGIARGLGASESTQAAAELAGKGALIGGTVLGGRQVKRKSDQWRYRHGFT